jgi:hypothetical protein
VALEEPGGELGPLRETRAGEPLDASAPDALQGRALHAVLREQCAGIGLGQFTPRGRRDGALGQLGDLRWQGAEQLRLLLREQRRERGGQGPAALPVRERVELARLEHQQVGEFPERPGRGLLQQPLELPADDPQHAGGHLLADLHGHGREVEPHGIRERHGQRAEDELAQGRAFLLQHPRQRLGLRAPEVRAARGDELLDLLDQQRDAALAGDLEQPLGTVAEQRRLFVRQVGEHRDRRLLPAERHGGQEHHGLPAGEGGEELFHGARSGAAPGAQASGGRVRVRGGGAGALSPPPSSDQVV